MSSWVVLCVERDVAAVARLVASFDASARVKIVERPDTLRALASESDPGALEVIVAPVGRGVSDINLAAAIADDGNVRRVILAAREVSGSLRSRAARAGIDLVCDLADFDEGPGLAVPRERGVDPAPPREGASAAGRVRGALGAPEPIAPDEEVARAPVLVLCSGRGGVGKTALAAGAAATAARWGLRVCLLDLDLSCGNAYACFGLGGGGDLSSLDLPRIDDQALARSCITAADGVSLAGPCARPEMSELVAPRSGEILECAARSFDLVIVDTSTTFSEAVAQAAQRADRLLLVSDGRPGSLASVARASGLAVRLGVARTRIARMENRVDPRGRPDASLGRSEVGLEAARCYRVVDGGREVADYLASGRVCELCEPGYPFADSLAAVLAQLLAEMGRLPACDEARQACESSRPHRRWPLFAARREAR